jgi:hypothetical protein
MRKRSRWLAILPSAAVLLVCINVASATDRYFSDKDESSPNGRFRLTAVSPDNTKKRPRPFQSDFCYTLHDVESGEILWQRDLTDWSPIRVWVHDDSSVVIWDARHDFVALDALTGEVRVEAPLRDLVPEEDWNAGHVVQSTAGPLWTRNAHFVFFQFDNRTWFGCRTGWDRVFVLDFGNSRSITDPTTPITSAMDAALRDRAISVLGAAADNPESIVGPRLYETDAAVLEALDIAGRLKLRDALASIRELERLNPASADPLPRFAPEAADETTVLRPFRLRQWAHTALRRLGEAPRPLPCTYVTEDWWSAPIAYLEIPADRTARVTSLAQNCSRADLLVALGPPDDILDGRNGALWLYAIDEHNGLPLLQVEFPDDGGLGTWKRIDDKSLLLRAPDERTEWPW